MSEEDIRQTASHEVAHLHHLGHDTAFQNKQSFIEKGMWSPPACTSGALPEDYSPPKEKKNKKEKPIKNRCNYHLCNKKTKTKKCKYCGKYFCSKHIEPDEPIIGKEALKYRIPKENSHPCFPYSRYLEKEAEKRRQEEDEMWKRISRNRRERNENNITILTETQVKPSPVQIKEDKEESIPEENKKPERKSIKKSKKNMPFKSLISTIIILIIIGALIYFLVFPYFFGPKCYDGTREGECSINKPWYCQDQNLIKNSSECGCEEGYTPTKWGDCSLK